MKILVHNIIYFFSSTYDFFISFVYTFFFFSFRFETRFLLFLLIVWLKTCIFSFNKVEFWCISSFLYIIIIFSVLSHLFLSWHIENQSLFHLIWICRYYWYHLINKTIAAKSKLRLRQNILSPKAMVPKERPVNNIEQDETCWKKPSWNSVN